MLFKDALDVGMYHGSDQISISNVVGQQDRVLGELCAQFNYASKILWKTYMRERIFLCIYFVKIHQQDVIYWCDLWAFPVERA